VDYSKVKKDFRGELHFAEMKDMEENTDVHTKAYIETWRKRSAVVAQQPEADKWRPKKRYRGASYEWALVEDNQITQTCNVEGLKHFQVHGCPS
jgi:hypothetical protein